MSAPIEEIQAANLVGADAQMGPPPAGEQQPRRHDAPAPTNEKPSSSNTSAADAGDEKFTGTTASGPAGATPHPPGSTKLSGWFHWHEPGTSPEEKRLIFKLDWFLLSYSCLCFFVKWLDSNNVTNAYASGMQEELGFGPGNELSWMNTYFNIGQLIGAPFANLIITVVRPRYWLPFCLTCWSLFVLFLYKCNTASEFYALRFCIGLFESAAWPGIEYTLGSWYRKSELARRSALFVISGVLGQMFSGYLQSALYSGMEGHGGMSAWRWLFIFDFIIAIPVAVYGIVCFEAPFLDFTCVIVFGQFTTNLAFLSSVIRTLPTTPARGTSTSGSGSAHASASTRKAACPSASWTSPSSSASSPAGRSTSSRWATRYGA